MGKELEVEITNCGLDSGPRVKLEGSDGKGYCRDYEKVGTRDYEGGNSGKWVKFRRLRGRGNKFVCEELSCRFGDPGWLRRCRKDLVESLEREGRF